MLLLNTAWGHHPSAQAEPCQALRHNRHMPCSPLHNIAAPQGLPLPMAFAAAVSPLDAWLNHNSSQPYHGVTGHTYIRAQRKSTLQPLPIAPTATLCVKTLPAAAEVARRACSHAVYLPVDGWQPRLLQQLVGG